MHDASKQMYYDGGVHYNNPVEVADRERKLIWPDLQDQEPDLLLSVGTAYNTRSKSPQSPVLARHVATKGMFAYVRYLAKLAVDHIVVSLDSEKKWHDYIDTKAPSAADRSRYWRLNTELDHDPPKMDDVGSIKDLQEKTWLQFGDSIQVKKLACHFVATCFYFEIGSRSGQGHSPLQPELSGMFEHVVAQSFSRS